MVLQFLFFNTVRADLWSAAAARRASIASMAHDV